MTQDRPVTQQGVMGLKTAVKESQRVVEDRTFYISLLHNKIASISKESSKISIESSQLEQERKTFGAMEAEVKEKIRQLESNTIITATYTLVVLLQSNNTYSSNSNSAPDISSSAVNFTH